MWLFSPISWLNHNGVPFKGKDIIKELKDLKWGDNLQNVKKWKLKHQEFRNVNKNVNKIGMPYKYNRMRGSNFGIFSEIFHLMTAANNTFRLVIMYN